MISQCKFVAVAIIVDTNFPDEHSDFKLMDFSKNISQNRLILLRTNFSFYTHVSMLHSDSSWRPPQDN